MPDAANFEIQILQIMRGDSAVSELKKTEDAIKAATSTVGSYERDYKKAMEGVEKAQKKLADAQATMDIARGVRMKPSEFEKVEKAVAKQAAALQEAQAAASQASAGLESAKDKAVGLAREYNKLSEAEKAAAEKAKQLEAAYKHMASINAKAKIDAEAESMSKLRISEAHAAEAMKKVTDQLERQAKAAAKAKAEQDKLVAAEQKKQMDSVGFGGGGDDGFNFDQMLGQFAGSATGAFAIVTAIFKVMKAMVQAALEVAVAILKWGIAAAEARRNTELTLQALVKSESAGSALAETMREIRNATGVNTDEMTEWVRQLKDAGMKTSSLDAALKGLALQKSATGQANVGKLVEDLKAGKTTAAKFAEEMKKVYGGIVDKKAMGLSEQWERAKDKIADIFSQVDLTPLLEAVKKLFAYLDDPRTVSMLKEMFESLVDSATQLVDAVRAIVGPLLEAYDAAKKLKDAITPSNNSAGAKGFGAAPWTAGLSGQAQAANDNGQSVGSRFASGLANGISSAIDLVTGAASAAALAAKTAAEQALDEHSPSKVGHYIGRMFGEGLAQGTESTEGRVAGATGKMVQIPAVRGAGGGRAPVTLHIGELVIQGVKGAEEAPERLRQRLTEVLVDVATEAAA